MNTAPSTTHTRSPLPGISIIVLVLLVFGLIAYFPGQVRSARQAASAAQLQLDDSTRKNEQLQNDVARLERELKTLHQSTDAEKTALNRLLTAEKAASLKLVAQVESAKTNAIERDARLDNAGRKIGDLEADLAGRMELINRLGKEARDARETMLAAKQESEARLAELQRRLDYAQKEITQLKRQAESKDSRR
jgi:chromosome segregation ATPase